MRAAILLIGVLGALAINACESKAEKENDAVWARLELVRVCGRTWVYRDSTNNRLLASSSALSHEWLAADVTVDQVCGGVVQ